jgi:hypothetical protein
LLRLPFIEERTYRRYRRIRLSADAREIPGKTKGVDQPEGEDCGHEEPCRTSQRKGDDARDQRERGRVRLTFHHHLMQRLAFLHGILVFGRGVVAEFNGFGNLTKALTFTPQRAGGVAECRVSRHVGLIHAFNAGHDFGRDKQPTLFHQLGDFRKVQPGIAEDLRGAVLSGLGNRNILRIHLLHGPLQGCHVIDHRKPPPKIAGR